MDADPRAELQRLVARLPEADVPAALRAVAELAAQRDPFLTHVLAAEEDDEELNEVGQRMLKEAREDSEAGRTHSLEEVEREFWPLRPTLRFTTRALRDLKRLDAPTRLRVLGRIKRYIEEPPVRGRTSREGKNLP